MWIHVIPHFEKFLAELELTSAQRLDALGKAERVAKSLYANYYPGLEFNPNCYITAGSFGKGTAIRPPSDVDLIFVLPPQDFHRIERLMVNKQSQLLQEVKHTLLQTFPSTDIRGDGPVVKVPFETYNFEVVPVFLCEDGTYINAHTSNGGSWRHSSPHAEYRWLQEVDARTLGKATHLIKMLKAWKRECNVDIRSICLEIVAVVFVDQWSYRDKDLFWYDWMIRDFFQHMINTYSAGGWTKPAGITDQILMGDKWQSKAQSAYERALKACEYEHADRGYSASLEWQKIFGSQLQLNIADLLRSASLGVPS